MIRPQPARWFEVVCARDDAFVLLEALAVRRCAEIEWHAGGDEGQAAAANRLLKEFADLAHRHRACWPEARMREAGDVKAPMAAFSGALAALRAWAAEAGPHVAALEEAERGLAESAIVERVIDAFAASDVDLRRLAAADGALRARVIVHDAGLDLDVPAEVLVHRFRAAGETHAVVLGESRAVEALEREAAALHGRVVCLPAWLGRDCATSHELLRERTRALESERAARRRAIDASLDRHGVALALGDVARAAWCFQHVGAVHAPTELARITGWTDDPARLAATVAGSGARALASFPPAPAGAIAPLLLRNPAWARPFEIFVRLFGVPGREGADPTLLLAVVSPLLFGFMFGDVGQGLVLLAAGLALRRRHAGLRLLIPGGLAAIAFGFAFGSVFAREDVIAPLWLAPLERPLTVLVLPVYAGAALLAVGLALRALEAWWRHAFAEWLRLEAGVALAYGGLLAAPWHAAGLALAGAGAAACIAGHVLDARGARAALTGAAQFAERSLQLLVNTVSFARVGAFALAHAGLSAAVVALATAAGGAGSIAVLVAGNLLVLVLEGLVVGIQTTRLILFEFFTRFLDTRGREFRPLLPPDAKEVHP